MLKTLVARSGLVLALVANLVLASMCFLSSGGQSQSVTLDVRGNTVQVRVDGLQVVPDPIAGQHTSLEIPESGTISFSASPPVPSLPDPQGIDSAEVRDSNGTVLLRDDFDSLDPSRWQITAGSFAIDDGVLVARNHTTPNILELRGAGWRDYTLEVRFRNGGAEQIGVRRSGSGGLYYHVFLYHPTTWAPSYVAAHREDGAWTGMVWGAPLNLDERGSITSMAAMVVGSYPLLLLALAGGAVGAVVLAMLEHLLRPALSGAAQQLPIPTLPPPIRNAAWPVALLALALAAFGVTAHIMWHYYDRVPHFVDEIGYIFQAKLFAAGRLTTAIPSVSEAFHVWGPYNWVFERDGRWSTFYFLGHPLALAPGVAVGAMWLVPPLLGGACVFLIGLIGRRLYDPVTGLVAALLLAASPFFLMQSSNFLSHVTWVFYLLMSIFLTLQRGRAPLFGALAGLFFGLAVNTRALEAVVLIPPYAVLLAWPLLRRETRVEAAGRCVGFLAGGAVAAVLMLLYNAALTGEALRPAYFDYPPGGSTLGFTDGHTLSVGLHNLQARLMALILLLNGWPAIVGLALVLLPFMLGSRNAWDYFCLVCALLVTGVYVLYPGAGFYEGPRVWLPAVPFLMLLSARGAVLGAGLISAVATRLRAETTGDRQPARWTGAALLAPVLLLLIADGTGGWLFGWNKDWLERNVPQVQNEISDLRDIGGYDNRLVARANEMHLENALILVRPCGQSAVVPPRAIFGCYGTVFIENSVDFNGDVVWAMYATERNERVIGAYPGRDVYIATWDPVSIVPFEPHGPLADEPP